MMRNPQNPRLLALIWWSLRLAWSRNKKSRRHIRARIWAILGGRWYRLAPDTVPGTELGIIRAVWLGAALASRSIVRYPLLPRRLKARMMLLLRIVGRTNGKAIITAYLAWAWLKDVAFAPAPDGWAGTRG